MDKQTNLLSPQQHRFNRTLARQRKEQYRYKGSQVASKVRKVVSFGDLHGNPHPGFINKIITANPDIIVVGGDLFDFEGASSHDMEQGHTPRSHDAEVASLQNFFDDLVDHTECDFKLLRGNHDHRLFNKIMEHTSAAYQRYIKDPLKELGADYPNGRWEVVSQAAQFHHPSVPTQEFGKTSYMYVLGDALFSHANFTGSKPGDAAMKLSAWVDNWRQSFGWPDFSLMVQYHTHQWAHMETRGGWLVLVEPGMIGVPAVEGYKLGYQAKWKPGSLGAMYFEQYEEDGLWKTDRASVVPLRP